jgi:hypothetical protein
MRMGAGAWIGLIVGGLGGLIGLAAAVIFGGLPGIIMAVVFIGIFGAVFYPLLIKPMMTGAKLRKNGVAATAKIIQVSDTGVTLNNSPQVKLLLEVTSPTGTYMVETKQYISRLQTAMYQPGAILPVLVDPNDRDMISINYDGNVPNSGGNFNPDNVMTGLWAGMSRQEAERKLLDYDTRGKEILSYGTSSRAIVSRYTWLGIYVNGQNPAVELEVQVMPSDRAAFQAIVYGVIMETSVPKYQPGEEIFVKYDPDNISKVTIEHS